MILQPATAGGIRGLGVCVRRAWRIGARYFSRVGPRRLPPEELRFRTVFVGRQPLRRDDTHIFVTLSELVRHRRTTALMVSFCWIAASLRDWIKSAGSFSWIGASGPLNSASFDVERGRLRDGAGAGSLAAGVSGSGSGILGKRLSYSLRSSARSCSSLYPDSYVTGSPPCNPHHDRTPCQQYRTGRHGSMIATDTAVRLCAVSHRRQFG